MNETQNAVVTEANSDKRTLVIVAYVLHLVGAVTGLASIIGLIINYVERGKADEVLDTHHNWMIRSFWWALLWSCVGVILFFVLIGWPVLVITWLWYVYRHIRGLIDLGERRSMP